MSADSEKHQSSTMREKIVGTIGDIVVAGVEATAQISLGQGLLRLADNFLWVVEKSAQWSLPVQEVNTEENGKIFGNVELVRPLPWIFFLPSLVMLRVCKFGINVSAVILGYPKLQATGMVKIIQKGRRRLRAIRSNAIKNMRCKKSTRHKDEELNEAKKSLIKSMLSTLSALSCLEASRRTPSPPPTRIYVQHNEADANQTPDEESTTESASPQVDPKRKYSQIVVLDDSSDISEEESTQAKLERLAAEDSDPDDRDFESPAEEEFAGSESSSTDEDGDVSDTEIMELLHPPENNTTIILAVGTISEEPKLEAQTEEISEIEEMNKTSTPNKTSEGKKLDSSQPGGKENAGNAAEHKTKSYPSFSSPDDVIKDVKSPEENIKSPVSNNAKENQTTPATGSSPQIGNGDLDSSVTSTISGNSTDGGTPTNGDQTTDEKRNNAGGKAHQKGKRTGIAQRKKK